MGRTQWRPSIHNESIILIIYFKASDIKKSISPKKYEYLHINRDPNQILVY